MPNKSFLFSDMSVLYTGDNPHLHNRLTAGDEDDEDTEEDLPHMTSRRSGQRAR